MADPGQPDPAAAAVVMLRDITEAAAAVARRMFGVPDDEEQR